MARNHVGRIFITGAIATVAIGLSPLAAAASDPNCINLSNGDGSLCSTDNSKTNSGDISSNPTQTSSTDSNNGGGRGGDASATDATGGAGGAGGNSLNLTEQHQTTTNAIGQAIDSNNASHSFNGNGNGDGAGASHRVVVGGRSFAANGVGGGSFVSLGVGGASNTGGSALDVS